MKIASFPRNESCDYAIFKCLLKVGYSYVIRTVKYLTFKQVIVRTAPAFLQDISYEKESVRYSRLATEGQRPDRQQRPARRAQAEALPGACFSNATGRPCRRCPANYPAFPGIGMAGVIGPAAPERRI